MSPPTEFRHTPLELPMIPQSGNGHVLKVRLWQRLVYKQETVRAANRNSYAQPHAPAMS
jgi:hypothetical protein